MTPLRRFCHALALRLGVRVREIEEWPMSELADWIMYDGVSPISDTRADYHAAMIASTVCRVQGGKATLKDFMPEWGAKAQDMTQDEIMAVAQAIKKQVEKHG